MASIMRWMANKKAYAPDHFHHASSHKQRHQSLEVIREHVQANFCLHALHSFRQEVRRPHPRLDGPERMLDRATSDPHSISTLIKLHLHVFEHILMLPVTRRCWLGVHLSLSGQPLQFELQLASLADFPVLCLGTWPSRPCRGR